MLTQRSGASAKIQRARRHVDELRDVLKAFAQSGPFAVEQTKAPNGDTHYVVRLLLPIPEELATIAGDAIHNARSALDHVAWHAVQANSGAAGYDTAFPIAADEDQFNKMLASRMKGASPRAIRLVRCLRPFREGNYRLWALNRLDNIDKHRLLLLVGAASAYVGILVSLPNPKGGTPIDFPELRLRPQETHFPLEDGAVLFTIKKAAQAGMPAVKQKPPNFYFSIYLGAGEGFSPGPVDAMVPDLVEYAGRVVKLFEDYVL